MERGSDKHSARADDEMAHEVRSMTQGAPVESRAEEYREQEGPGDGEPTPDARLSGDRGLTPPDALTPDEIEARSELARYLERRVFPGDRDALIASAQRLNAPSHVVERLGALPDGQFTHVEAVWEALGGRVEFRG
jgi:hypothetical protein